MVKHILDHIKDTPGKSGKTSRKFRFHIGKKVALLLVTLLVLLIITGAAAGLTAMPVLALAKLAQTAQTQAQETAAVAKTQDLVQAQEKLKNLSTTLDQMDAQMKKLSWHQYTPFRAYYQDGTHLLAAGHEAIKAGNLFLDTVNPYADVLGLKGQGSFTGGTAEDRLLKILETIDKVAPALNQVKGSLNTINTQLAAVDPGRYPFVYKGIKISDALTQAKSSVNSVSEILNNYQPLIEVLPKMAGTQKPKKYFVLFQNDAELRATGGFMTAYGIVSVDKGKVHQETSDDIYALDTKFNSKLKLPDSIKKYLPLVFNWHLRDMNLSPDFKTSMDTFYGYAKSLPQMPKDLDGIVTVDTQVLTDLIKVLGPVDVAGFGTFTTENDPRCNCPQVIYALENIASRPLATIKTDRKAFLGPMMSGMIAKAYSAPKQNWPGLSQVLLTAIAEKHLLVYDFDEATQTAIEQANIGGRVRETPGDYFMAVDSNFGGAKSNLFITEEVEDNITPGPDSIQHQVTITYKNPAPPSNCNLEAGQLCLNGTYRDYFRLYLPAGTKLADTLGFEAETVRTYEELGKFVVEGFFKFNPQSQAKLKISYAVPNTSKNQYSLLIQKQPGKKKPKYTLLYNNEAKQEFELTGDKEVKF